MSKYEAWLYQVGLILFSCLDDQTRVNLMRKHAKALYKAWEHGREPAFTACCVLKVYKL